MSQGLKYLLSFISIGDEAPLRHCELEISGSFADSAISVAASNSLDKLSAHVFKSRNIEKPSSYIKGICTLKINIIIRSLPRTLTPGSRPTPHRGMRRSSPLRITVILSRPRRSSLPRRIPSLILINRNQPRRFQSLS